MALVLLNDFKTDAQSQAGSLTHGFCGEKWIKNFGAYLGGDAGAAIANANLNIARCDRSGSNRQLLGVTIAIEHGIQGVGNNIGKYLVKLGWEAAHQGEVAVVFDHAHMVFDAMI